MSDEMTNSRSYTMGVCNTENGKTAFRCVDYNKREPFGPFFKSKDEWEKRNASIAGYHFMNPEDRQYSEGYAAYEAETKATEEQFEKGDW